MKYEKNQAVAQVNVCGNGKLPLNVFCDNQSSQVHGNREDEEDRQTCEM
jgi:hypothetical protein